MASKTTLLLLLAASQLLATQAYDPRFPGQPSYYDQPVQPQGPRRRAEAYNPQGVPQIAPRFGEAQDTQQQVDDGQQIEVVDMSRRPAPAPAAATRPPPTSSYMDLFSSKLFQVIAPASGGRNLVYSPVSVHALMSLIYGSSEGKTLLELEQVGKFRSQLGSAADFKELIENKKDLGDVDLVMATKVYYSRQLGGVNPSYPPFAKHYFRAGIEAVDMENGKDTAAKINVWVSDNTRGKIRDFISASDLDSRTQALLVNAIYFKGRWQKEFATMDTLPYKFQHTDGSSSSVAMMYNDDTYGLADLPELDATALELPYKDSATSMLILLPKQLNGLSNLERQLASHQFDLNRIASRIRRQTVTVRLPKFRVEFEQDMTAPLQQLGVKQMFTPQSQITKVLNQPVRVEKILQKAFIDVGEAGTEAAAASYAKFVPLSLPEKSPEFTADHPFVFAIRTPSSVLFMGHVDRPTLMAPGTDALSRATNSLNRG